MVTPAQVELYQLMQNSYLIYSRMIYETSRSVFLVIETSVFYLTSTQEASWSVGTRQGKALAKAINVTLVFLRLCS